jgi:hypothetical protein
MGSQRTTGATATWESGLKLRALATRLSHDPIGLVPIYLLHYECVRLIIHLFLIPLPFATAYVAASRAQPTAPL